MKPGNIACISKNLVVIVWQPFVIVKSKTNTNGKPFVMSIFHQVHDISPILFQQCGNKKCFCLGPDDTIMEKMCLHTATLILHGIHLEENCSAINSGGNKC